MWATCRNGHRHWGRYGAAGLLVLDADRVLLQLRSRHVHHGGTWAIPGGAIGAGETPRDAALREAAEETGIDPAAVRVLTQHPAPCGGWTYTTVVVAPTGDAPTPRGHWEADAHAWVPLAQVSDHDLHPAFAATWRAGLRRSVTNLGETREP